MKYGTLAIACCAAFLLGNDECGGSARQKEAYAVERAQSNILSAQPIPSYDWSLERDRAIQLYNQRNAAVRTHTVWRSDFGMVEGDCPSRGFGLPYDVQLTNPLMRAYRDAVVEQPEPNGLFSSHNTTATWVFCVVDGRVAPIYVESKVTTYPYTVSVDYDTNRVRRADGAEPSVSLKSRSR